MLTRRYAQFNFRLLLGGVMAGGFQEVTGLEKIRGLNKSTDVTLKRGVIGAPALNQWLKSVRGRTVTIELRDEAGRVGGRWILSGAKLVKYSAGAMNAKGNDVPMEELVLAYQRLSFKAR